MLRYRSSRAQAALEFMVFFGFFALLFLFISSVLLESYASKIRKREWELGREFSLVLRDEINNAVSVGDGYWKKVDLRGRELGVNYTVRIRDGNLELRWGEQMEAVYVLASREITGLPSDSEGMVLDVGEPFVVRNRGGVVVLEQ